MKSYLAHFFGTLIISLCVLAAFGNSHRPANFPLNLDQDDDDDDVQIQSTCCAGQGGVCQLPGHAPIGTPCHCITFGQLFPGTTCAP